MRAAFCRTLMDLATNDARILLLTGDLGYTVLEPYAETFPTRFFNVGVAEQNMLGVATGLAQAGFIPYVYSISTFAALRPYEFIRNGPVLHRLPVRIVGVGGGFEYGHAGPTHHGLEDIGVMRIQPDLTIIAPADHLQTTKALLATWDLPGPIYYRLGKNDTAVVPGLHGRFTLGHVEILGEGDDLLLVSAGAIATEVVLAAQLLADKGVAATVALVSSFTSASANDLVRWLGRVPLAVTVEAHYLTGGLGSFAAELIAERELNCRLVRCGARELSTGLSGSQDYFHRAHGLSGKSVATIALSALHEQSGAVNIG
jgi:transketolase